MSINSSRPSDGWGRSVPLSVRCAPTKLACYDTGDVPGRILYLVACSAVVLGLGPVSAPAPRIVMDGFFDDWATVPIVARDAGDAPGTPIDFGEVRATGNGDALFLMIETGPAVNLRAVDGTLSVRLDVDGDPSA